MNLKDVKLNTVCVIKSIDVLDAKTKIRLMELGLVEGTKVMIRSRSVLKKTMLMIFNSSCFTLKDNIASMIEVEYA